MKPITEWGSHALRRAYAMGLRHAADGDADWRVLTSAGDALHARLSRLYGDVRKEEVAAFRNYLGAVVRTANPLLLRVCELENVDLDSVVARLRPLGAWPRWLCGATPHHRWLKSTIGGINARPSPSQRAAWRFEKLAQGGLVVQDRHAAGIPFGVRVLDRGVEMAALLGEHLVRTHGRDGSLTLRLTLPETLLAGLLGRPLDHLVDHPLLSGAGCVVTQVDQPNRRGTKVRFAVDLVPWQLPWVRGSVAGEGHGDQSVAVPKRKR